MVKRAGSVGRQEGKKRWIFLSFFLSCISISSSQIRMEGSEKVIIVND